MDEPHSQLQLVHTETVSRGRLGTSIFLFRATACLLVLTGVILKAFSAQSADLPAAASSEALTNILQIYGLPQQERDQAHQIHTEVLLYYYDLDWNVAFGECYGRPSWFPLASSGVPLKRGQRIAIDGVIFPREERFDWSHTQIKVLAEDLPLPAEKFADLTGQMTKWKRVTVEGLVDNMINDPTHTSFNFQAGGASARVHVMRGPSHELLRCKVGDLVRLTGTYSSHFDALGKLTGIELWVAGPEDLEEIGSAPVATLFARQAIPIDQIQESTPTNALVRIEGMVRSREPGHSVTVWDSTGQIMVQSSQTDPLGFGDRIEAVGIPQVIGVRQFLRAAIYRREMVANAPTAASDTSVKPKTLRLAEQVRNLSREEAAQGLPVRLRAIVMWHT